MHPTFLVAVIEAVPNGVHQTLRLRHIKQMRSLPSYVWKRKLSNRKNGTTRIQCPHGHCIPVLIDQQIVGCKCLNDLHAIRNAEELTLVPERHIMPVIQEDVTV